MGVKEVGATRRSGDPPRMIRTFLVVVCLLGCGPTLSELVVAERFDDACEVAYDDLDDPPFFKEVWDHQAPPLATALAQHTDIVFEATVLSQAQLQDTLGYVPARMASGETVLMHTKITVNAIPSASAGSWLTVRDAPVHRFDGPVDWLRLDGREEAAAALQAELEAREERARTAPRERRGLFRGIARIFQVAGGLVAGLGADLLYISTLGGIDIDVSHIPMAGLSPIQLIRRVSSGIAAAQSAAAVNRSALTAEDASRAQAAGVLDHILAKSWSRCFAVVGDSCEFYELLDRDDPDAPMQVRLSVDYTFEQVRHCELKSSVLVDEPLEPGTTFERSWQNAYAR